MVIRVTLVDSKHVLVGEKLHEVIADTLAVFINMGKFAFLVSDKPLEQTDKTICLTRNNGGWFACYESDIEICTSSLKKIFGRVPARLYIGFPEIEDKVRHGEYHSRFVKNRITRKR